MPSSTRANPRCPRSLQPGDHIWCRAWQWPPRPPPNQSPNPATLLGPPPHAQRPGLVTVMGVCEKPRQSGLHGGGDQLRPCLGALAWCCTCVQVCARAPTTPDIHRTLPHPHTTLPHIVASGHTGTGRVSQPDPLTFCRFYIDTACEPGRGDPRGILQCRGCQPGRHSTRVPGHVDCTCCAHKELLTAWATARPCGHRVCARAASWQRGEQDARRAVSSRTRQSLRQPWLQSHLGCHRARLAGLGQVERREQLARRRAGRWGSARHSPGLDTSQASPLGPNVEASEQEH